MYLCRLQFKSLKTAPDIKQDELERRVKKNEKKALRRFEKRIESITKVII